MYVAVLSKTLRSVKANAIVAALPPIVTKCVYIATWVVWYKAQPCKRRKDGGF